MVSTSSERLAAQSPPGIGTAGPDGLFVASLNSGSNGNCYYIGNRNEAVLIDAGISCRETERRLKRLELPIKKVKAIFITHEHSDHIYGVSRLSKKHQIPVYITARTFQDARIYLKAHLKVNFKSFDPIQVGNLSITSFPIQHDAVDPHGFLVEHGGTRVGVFTDIGNGCHEVCRHFEKCHAAFLESNYDEGMLESGRYPVALKNRIRGGKGHLSNSQAVQLFMQHRPSFMGHLFLSHLSEENNSPHVAGKLFRKVAGRTSVIVASRYEETQVYHITNTFEDRPIQRWDRKRNLQLQLSLFNP